MFLLTIHQQQQLGYQAIDMTQQNMSDNEINDFLSNRFLEVKEKAEQNVDHQNSTDSQLCEDKSVSYSDYKYSYEYYQCHPSDRFRKATLPCWYILCILKDTMKPFIHLPHGLDIRHGLLIWNAITELTIKCIDRISTNLCDQLHCTEIELVSRIHENPGFRDTVYDLIIDAEKDCKKKVLNDEGIEEADFILFNLINRDSKQLSDGITAVENKKIEKLRNLGIYI